MRYEAALYKGDTLDVMSRFVDQSVDMILCDLPYGTTACKWDTVIPFEPLWEQYKRIIKPNGAIVLFGGEPFSSLLRTSNLEMFKYDWIWEKSKAVGFVNAKLKPMPKHETISVFSFGKTSNGNQNNMIYNPQDLVRHGKTVRGRKGSAADSDGNGYGRPSMKSEYVQEFTNYPTTVLQFGSEGSPQHPTQKPVALCEYLVRTYTNESALVLDNTMGSGTTGVACMHTKRYFAGIERDDKYFAIAEQRIDASVWGDAVDTAVNLSHNAST